MSYKIEQGTTEAHQPPWSVLSIVDTKTGELLPITLTRGEAEKLHAEMTKALFPHTGQSLLQKLWEELDAIVERLHAEGQPDRDHWDDWHHWGQEQGRAQGTAYAIAVVEQPYKPNVEDVRSRAQERWEATHGQA